MPVMPYTGPMKTQTSNMNRFLSYTNLSQPLGCWPWLGAVNASGYGKFWMAGKTIPAHRASYILHHGLIPEDGLVIHSCTDRTCVNPAHLQTGTHRENMKDMVARGRSLRGEKNAGARLSEKQVQDIIINLHKGMAHRTLAKSYGVSRTTIRGIATRRIWVHVWDQMGVILAKLKVPSSGETSHLTTS